MKSETDIPQPIAEKAEQTGARVRYFGRTELVCKTPLHVDKDSTLYASKDGVYIVGNPEVS